MKKIVIVLNKKAEEGRVINAMGHMMVGLIGKYSDINFGSCDYIDKDGGSHLGSQYPIIILKSKNSNQIRTLRQAAIDQNLPFASQNDCLKTKTDDEQIELSKNTAESDLEYYGICLVGTEEELNPLTKKFSLWG